MADMIRFATYDPASGAILSTGICPADIMSIQPMNGAQAIQVDEGVTSFTHKVVDGAVVPIGP